MALEAIREIKSCEQKAEEIIKNSTAEGKAIVQNAGELAQKEYNNTIDGAKKKAEEIIQDGIEEGNKIATPILEDGRKSSEGILNISDEKKNDAAKIVIERIVKIHGNS
ncbi:MAG: ATPase [Clostridium sp.]